MLSTSQLTLLSIIAAVATSQDSYEGCVSVLNGKCHQCFERKVLKDGAGCGELLPAENTCAIYQLNRDGHTNTCIACLAKYAFNPVGQGRYVCVKGTIPGCLIEALLPGGRHECAGCEPGKYSVNSAKGDVCKAISNPAPHCVFGSFLVAGKARCFKCDKNHGVDVVTGMCVPSQEGCWAVKGGKCITCDPYYPGPGYYMDATGKCVQN